jgi:hypothetical protein
MINRALLKNEIDIQLQNDKGWHPNDGTRCFQ